MLTHATGIPMPRLCIPIEVKPQGGMFTFVGNLTRWLEQHAWSYTTKLTDPFDVLFVNSWVVPPSVVRRAKQANVNLRVAHRIDGSAEDYGSDPASDGVQGRVNLFADITIFQSAYSRYSAREKFKVIAHDGPVIYNPVDVDQFTPAGVRIDLPPGRPRVACASWSTNPRKGTWHIDSLAEKHQHVLFVLCGRFDAVRDRPNIVRLGHLHREAMAAALRSCDALVNLSENDPCPNVVLEALASGLPVLYRPSGGVPELVGDCGMAIEVGEFAEALECTMARRAELSGRARERAVTNFSSAAVFPQYMNAIVSSARAPLPSRFDILRLAAAGYPVIPPLRSPRRIVTALRRRAPSLLVGRQPAHLRVGWITYDSFPDRKRHFRQLDSFTGMRVGNVARWMNNEQSQIVNELYRTDRLYDIVVFQKMMDARCQSEADKIRACGGRVVFDANVNYYEVWGEYFVPGTRPSEDLHADAVRMTATADWVVADSSYLAQVIRPLNPRVTVIADNVDLKRYRHVRQHGDRRKLRLVWSGIAKKAVHLLSISPALSLLSHAELVLVVDAVPDCRSDLERVIPCRVVRFSDRTYARTLAQCDVLISPKQLINAYEMGHTEYKITLGMAAGLPVIASPQPSYVEAVEHAGGGIIASSTEEWCEALVRLGADATLRSAIGRRGRQTVIDRYATEVVAKRYLDLLRTVAVLPDAKAAVS